MKKDLYLVDAKGKMRIWSIETREDGLATVHGLVDGAKQKEYEFIDFGLANRTKEEQIESKFKSKVKKRKERGYCEDIEVAKKRGGRGLNELGLPRPMLASKYRDVDVDPSTVYVQHKIDGHRCIISKQGDEIIAYSRNGKVINSIDHIIENIRKMVPGDIILDGELYHHGTPLQTISSWVRRPQEDSKKLKYYVYDSISEDCFITRIANVHDAVGNLLGVVVVPTIYGSLSVKNDLEKAIEGGWEGLILRRSGVGYETGKRSKNLIKVKHFEDDEFIVCGVEKSADGWGVLVCIAKNGNLFRVCAPGNGGERVHVADNPKQYIGKTVRVEYANLTPDGIPFHPVATMWRNKEDE